YRGGSVGAGSSCGAVLGVRITCAHDMLRIPLPASRIECCNCMSTPLECAALLVRGGAVWQLVGLITRRSQVQILPPLPIFPTFFRPPSDSSVGNADKSVQSLNPSAALTPSSKIA